MNCNQEGSTINAQIKPQMALLVINILSTKKTQVHLKLEKDKSEKLKLATPSCDINGKIATSQFNQKKDEFLFRFFNRIQRRFG